MISVGRDQEGDGLHMSLATNATVDISLRTKLTTIDHAVHGTRNAARQPDVDAARALESDAMVQSIRRPPMTPGRGPEKADL